MQLATDGERLPCGTDLGALVDQVAEDLPPADPRHEASCEYCQAALAELGPLWGQVRELAREDVVVPAALLASVMQTVRSAQTPNGGTQLPLRDVIPQFVKHAVLLGDRGTLKIADSVVALIIGREVLATPGVWALGPRDLRSVLGGSPGVEVVVGESLVSARLRVVVELEWPIPDVLEAVRQRANTAVQKMSGLVMAGIDITVTDVRERGV